ncbi:MAG TPA: UDP-N-acetylglucosamine 4,6-dehydratase family protein [Ktedonobacteraceae bacterium]|nr:UDP-N-acetylglucosamine 4,6-dehydratase family protein [Ktedonobacteraceae bacterium]
MDISNLNELDFGKLLDREVIVLHTQESYTLLKRQTILVTGAAGSIGSELCRQLLNYDPLLVIGLDTNETGLFDLAESLHSHPNGKNFLPYIGDITDVIGIKHLLRTRHPDIIFHAAAYKHVPLLEQYPAQAVRTNALATYSLCLLAQEHGVERFTFVSTDKAVAPTSVMGATKRICELIVQALARTNQGPTCFCAVRFGNVIGSRGSVVPIFANQIRNGGPITITDSEASRYFMTIPEACGLVLLATTYAESGHIYLLDMGKPVRIVDLAHRMLRYQHLKAGRDIEIVYMGLRPGERLHEMLVAEDEELISTGHHKISSIICKSEVPGLLMLGQWMRELDNSLLNGDDARLRALVFAYINQPDLIVA